MKTKVFISYASDEYDLKLMKRLKSAIDKTSELEAIVVASKRSAQTSLAQKVKDGITEAKFFVPILTKDSMANQWVNQEIGYATGLGKDVLPLVQEEIMSKLKGFVHKENDQPYKFGGKSKSLNQKDAMFRSAYKWLIKDLRDKLQDGDTSYSKMVSSGYTEKDDEVNIPIGRNTSFTLRIMCASIGQRFLCYYSFVTNKHEEKWIGFSNRDDLKEGSGSEHILRIGKADKLTYEFTENIADRVAKVAHQLGIEGTAKRAVRVRLRGDSDVKGELEFFYRFDQ